MTRRTRAEVSSVASFKGRDVEAIRRSNGEVSLAVCIRATMRSGFTGTREHVARHAVLLSPEEAADLRRFLEDIV